MGDDVSKKVKGKDYAYCPKVKAKATTDDHVFAREFFTLADRHNLPKAPACKKCNGDKGKFEHYLTATLPFAGRHAQAAENLQVGVPGRLGKNQKLSRELMGSLKPGWIRENGGLYQKTNIINFDNEKLQSWLKVGMTPTTCVPFPSIWIVRFKMPGSRPKRLVHSPSPIITTSG